MKEYQVEGVGIETGRRRRRVYRAQNDQHLVEVAKADGTQIHSYELAPPPKATEAQRDYAQQLGIKLSSDATKSQATDLITNKVEGDPLASMTDRRIAESFGVELDPIEDRYIGTRTLRLSVCSKASKSPREHARWLALRILQDYGPPISEVKSGDFRSARLVDLADQLASDEAFLRSLRRRDCELDAEQVSRDRTYSFQKTVKILGVRTNADIRVESDRVSTPSLESERVPLVQRENKRKSKGFYTENLSGKEVVLYLIVGLVGIYLASKVFN